MAKPRPLEEILEQIEGFDVGNLSPEDKTRLSKALQKKLGLDSGINVQNFRRFSDYWFFGSVLFF